MSSRSKRSLKRRTSSFRRSAGRPDASLSRQRENDCKVLELVSFEVTDGPMPDRTLDGLSAEDREQILKIGSRIIDGTGNQVELLEELVQRFPDIPKIYNFLSIAWLNAGRQDKAREWIERTYRRFPNYLFAMTNYCQELLRQGRVPEVARILDGRMSLHLWLPGRRCYHVSEVVAFMVLMVSYFAKIGEYGAADDYYRMLRKMAPDHPGTRQIASVLRESILRSTFRALTRPLTRGHQPANCFHGPPAGRMGASGSLHPRVGKPVSTDHAGT